MGFNVVDEHADTQAKSCSYPPIEPNARLRDQQISAGSTGGVNGKLMPFLMLA
jgi:hypothetical protein